ncbi:MAG: tetratricopeptide repeat protein [Opitutaceae bacterium]
MPALRLPALFLALTSASFAALAPDDLAAARALFNERGKATEAQQAFEQLAAADPKHPDVNYFLGQLANRRGEPEKASAYFQAALTVEPNAARHHHGLGDAHGRSAVKAGLLSKWGLAKKCLAAYERAVALDPSGVNYRLSLFEFYRQAPGFAGGGFDKAAAQAAEIKKLNPTSGRLAYMALYVGEKKYPEAFAQFDEALASNPDDYFAHFQIGRLAATTGQFLDRGIESLRRCLALPVPKTGPSHAFVHGQLGQLFEKKGDLTAARAAYEAALKLDPNLTPAAEALKKLK